jgi:hypothetical protein
MTPERNIIGPADFRASGINIVRNPDALKPLVPATRWDVTEEGKRDLRTQIRQVFFVDQILQLLVREGPAMTATEVQVKVQLLQQILGPTYGRLKSEGFDPLIDRVFRLLQRGGVIPPVPQALASVPIDVEYEGPLARAQRSQELMGIERTLQVLVAIAPIDPKVMDLLDTDEIIRLTADISSAPRSIIRDQAAVLQLREERAQQEAQAEGGQVALGASEVAKNVAPLMKLIQGAQGPTPGTGGPTPR